LANKFPQSRTEKTLLLFFIIKITVKMRFLLRFLVKSLKINYYPLYWQINFHKAEQKKHYYYFLLLKLQLK
jgi:hypothetical protein